MTADVGAAFDWRRLGIAVDLAVAKGGMLVNRSYRHTEREREKGAGGSAAHKEPANADLFCLSPISRSPALS